MLSNLHLETLVHGIHEQLSCINIVEFSFEANPATFTEKKAKTWAKLGINRVSLGVQSWDKQILHTLGREHTPEQAEKSYQILKQTGIKEINIDLMFSIPGQTKKQWTQSLEKTITLNPEHISTYNLTYEEDTEFYTQLQKGDFSSDTDQDADLFEYTDKILTQAGYRHYETSNYCRNDKISLHNMGYWSGKDYLGIGPGAVSTIKGTRTHNTPDTELYIQTTLKNGFPQSIVEKLSTRDILLERFALMLRTDIGLPVSYLDTNNIDRAHLLIKEGLACINENNHLILIDRGRMLVDEIVMELTP